MIWLKLMVALSCSALFWWGGFNWHNARRFIMPLVLAITCFVLSHSWWCFAMLAVIGIFCLGYGEKSPLRHCFGDGWGRGIWGLLAALCISLPLFLSHHLAWYWFALYLAMSFTLENALKKLPQAVGDPIIGAAFGSIVFFIK